MTITHPAELTGLPLCLDGSGGSLWPLTPGAWSEILSDPTGSLAQGSLVRVVDLLELLRRPPAKQRRDLNEL